MNCDGARHDFAPSCSAPARKVNESAVRTLTSELAMTRHARTHSASRETNWLNNALHERSIRLGLEQKIADLKAAIVELGGTIEEVAA